ncbi:MAG: adenosine deaminase [Candidatus Eisenbacteria bacterium]|nr:adenosine deaminase [Candidatus Eisenbacteria bacterium]
MPKAKTRRRAAPAPALTPALIKKLPKTDLHVHLDGCVRIPTMLDLAKERRVRLPSQNPVKLRNFMRADRGVKDLTEYIRKFDVTLSVMQDRPAITRIAYELAEDAARENVRYMEVRYSPILHVKRGMKLPEIVDAVIDGLRRAERDFGIRTGLIICGIRHILPKWSLELAELTVAYKNRGVVAFDLAGAEKDFPAKAHKAAFQKILKHNINSTVHAGEAFGPASIAQAIHHCGAHRIGHGTMLKEDLDLLNYVNDHRIPLEICLSSNVQTHAVADMRHHPFKFYYDYGLRVTLNTDNRLMSNTTVTRELSLAVKTFHLGPADLRNIIINGFKCAFLPLHEKVEMLRQAIIDMDEILAEGTDFIPGKEYL